MARLLQHPMSSPTERVSDKVLDALRELLTNKNLGLVTKEDLARVEERLDDLSELVDAVEAKLERKHLTKP